MDNEQQKSSEELQNQTTQTTPEQNQENTPAEPAVKPKSENGVGALIGSIIVIILLIIGTIYLWNNKITQPANNNTEATNMPALSTSDNINSLEQDLQNTTIDLETEFNNLDINL